MGRPSTPACKTSKSRVECSGEVWLASSSIPSHFIAATIVSLALNHENLSSRCRKRKGHGHRYFVCECHPLRAATVRWRSPAHCQKEHAQVVHRRLFVSLGHVRATGSNCCGYSQHNSELPRAEDLHLFTIAHGPWPRRRQLGLTLLLPVPSSEDITLL